VALPAFAAFKADADDTAAARRRRLDEDACGVPRSTTDFHYKVRGEVEREREERRPCLERQVVLRVDQLMELREARPPPLELRSMAFQRGLERRHGC
jgi:hypothetical protein